MPHIFSKASFFVFAAAKVEEAAEQGELKGNYTTHSLYAIFCICKFFLERFR